MKISKLMLVIKACQNGVTGVLGYLLEVFNEQVLARIEDKDEFAAYAGDVAAVASFLDGVFGRHEKWMGEAKRPAFSATINAIRELADALKDATVTEDELDAVVGKVKDAVEAWKRA